MNRARCTVKLMAAWKPASSPKSIWFYDSPSPLGTRCRRHWRRGRGMRGDSICVHPCLQFIRAHSPQTHSPPPELGEGSGVGAPSPCSPTFPLVPLRPLTSRTSLRYSSPQPVREEGRHPWCNRKKSGDHTAYATPKHTPNRSLPHRGIKGRSTSGPRQLMRCGPRSDPTPLRE
jgi:hypothetical protein